MIRTYPFAGIFIKEPLDFIDIEPAVHDGFWEYALLERKSLGLKWKYVFSNYSFATEFVLAIKTSF